MITFKKERKSKISGTGDSGVITGKLRPKRNTIN